MVQVLAERRCDLRAVETARWGILRIRQSACADTFEISCPRRRTVGAKCPQRAVSTALLFLYTLFICNIANAQAPHTNETPAEHAAHSKPVDEKTESNVDYFWRKSDEAFHAGDFERAIQLHRAIVALDPQDTESFSVGAWLMWSLGHKDDATAFIARGIQANPESSEMWDQAAQHYDLQKLAPESLNAYKQAVAYFPKDAPLAESQMLRRRLAHSAERGGDLNLSVQTWRDLVRDFPDEAVNKNNLARVEALEKK